ncbi:MAG: lysine 2,3-aminomutase [candidate division KSB1 bacterium]|nr:lysine 2,3-aminomutase [candidate division KSB1 bacterium]
MEPLTTEYVEKEPPGTSASPHLPVGSPQDVTLVFDEGLHPAQRSPLWEGVTPEQWNDWRWQMQHRITTVEQLRQLINLTPDEEQAMRLKPDLRVAITPHFAALMDPNDPRCPIRRQVVPTMAEFVVDDPDLEDPLGEDAHMPVPGLVHRYPDRVLVDITDQCVAYCRHCTRRRWVGTGAMPAHKNRIEAIAQYLEAHPEVRDVLLSGGDGLFLSDEMLDYALGRFRAVKSVEILRIGSRIPIFLPQRITDTMVATLRKYHPLWINIHINHPKEFTPEVRAGLAKLADAGIPLGAQTVLMAGINDCVNTMKALVHECVRNRVRPYYLYQCDLSQGIGHFRTPVSVGLSIIEGLRGHTTGFAIPTFVIDAPGGGGKVPIMPNYFISMNDRKVIVRNFEGVITTYSEPPQYDRHQSDNCDYCRRAAPKEGVAKLLAGDAVVLEPEGLRRKQRRVKKLDAEKKTRRRQQLRLPVKAIQSAELLPLGSPISTPRRSRSNGNENAKP